MKLVPVGVVLAAAVFFGLARERVDVAKLIYLFVGFGAPIALMALASYDYGAKRRIQNGR
jgi:hypothetical protein